MSKPPEPRSPDEAGRRRDRVAKASPERVPALAVAADAQRDDAWSALHATAGNVGTGALVAVAWAATTLATPKPAPAPVRTTGSVPARPLASVVPKPAVRITSSPSSPTTVQRDNGKGGDTATKEMTKEEALKKIEEAKKGASGKAPPKKPPPPPTPPTPEVVKPQSPVKGGDKGAPGGEHDPLAGLASKPAGEDSTLPLAHEESDLDKYRTEKAWHHEWKTAGSQTEETDPAALVKNALLQGAGEGLLNAAKGIATDVVMNQLSRKIPYAAGFVGLAQIVQAGGPGPWLQSQWASSGAVAVAGAKKLFGKDVPPIDRFEGFVDVLDGINNAIGVLSTICFIVAALGLVASIFFPPIFPFVALAAKWGLLLGNVSTVGSMIVTALKLVVMIMRTVQILSGNADPEEQARRAEKLRQTTAQFTQAYAQRAGNRMVAGASRNKEERAQQRADDTRSRAQKIADVTSTALTGGKAGTAAGDVKTSFRDAVAVSKIVLGGGGWKVWNKENVKQAAVALTAPRPTADPAKPLPALVAGPDPVKRMIDKSQGGKGTTLAQAREANVEAAKTAESLKAAHEASEKAKQGLDQATQKRAAAEQQLADAQAKLKADNADPKSAVSQARVAHDAAVAENTQAQAVASTKQQTYERTRAALAEMHNRRAPSEETRKVELEMNDQHMDALAAQRHADRTASAASDAQNKVASFSFNVRMGEFGVEIAGTRAAAAGREAARQGGHEGEAAAAAAKAEAARQAADPRGLEGVSKVKGSMRESQEGTRAGQGYGQQGTGGYYGIATGWLMNAEWWKKAFNPFYSSGPSEGEATAGATAQEKAQAAGKSQMQVERETWQAAHRQRLSESLKSMSADLTDPPLPTEAEADRAAGGYAKADSEQRAAEFQKDELTQMAKTVGEEATAADVMQQLMAANRMALVAEQAKLGERRNAQQAVDQNLDKQKGAGQQAEDQHAGVQGELQGFVTGFVRLMGLVPNEIVSDSGGSSGAASETGTAVQKGGQGGGDAKTTAADAKAGVAAMKVEADKASGDHAATHAELNTLDAEVAKGKGSTLSGKQTVITLSTQTNARIAQLKGVKKAEKEKHRAAIGALVGWASEHESKRLGVAGAMESQAQEAKAQEAESNAAETKAAETRAPEGASP